MALASRFSAPHNLLGGTDAAAGNLVAFNLGPGVDVEGQTSVGNQITANRIFANDILPPPSPAGALRFSGEGFVNLPLGLISNPDQSETLEASFQTTSGGVILGYQSAGPGYYYPPNEYVPVLYVGTDGKLYGGSHDAASSKIFQVTSNAPVNDGRWHNVGLVFDGAARTATLYLDGQLVGSASGAFTSMPGSFNQIGTGYTDSWPSTSGYWYGFVGQINDVHVWSEVRTAGEIDQDMTTASQRHGAGAEGRLSLQRRARPDGLRPDGA